MTPKPLIFATLICLTVLIPTAAALDVNIPDPALEAAIRAELGKPTGQITDTDMAGLVFLSADPAGITDLTGLEFAVNLVKLGFRDNQISNISPVANLTNLETLFLAQNRIIDISPVANLTNLGTLWMWDNQISDISAVANLTILKGMDLSNNQISDITAIASLTELLNLNLERNQITDINVVANFTNLRNLSIGQNQISNIGSVGNLTNLSVLSLFNNRISDIGAVENLTNLNTLKLDRNQFIDITVLANLTNLGFLSLGDNNISDIQPLVNNPGIDAGDTVDLTNNPLSLESVLVYVPALQARGVTVTAGTQTTFNLSVPEGISLVHIPLKVTAVNGQPMELNTVGDFFDALGADNVNFIITRDAPARAWRSYLGDASRGKAADQTITDYLGLIVIMKKPVTLALAGEAITLGTIQLFPGENLIGIPLDPSLSRVSDILGIDGIRGNATAIAVEDAGIFKTVTRRGDDGDLPLTAGHAFIITTPPGGTSFRLGGTVRKATGEAVGTGFKVEAVNQRVPTGWSTRTAFKTREDGSYDITFLDPFGGRTTELGDEIRLKVVTTDPRVVGAKTYFVTQEALDNGGATVDIPLFRGDVNADGVISAFDAALIRQFVAGAISLTPAQQAAADVNGDNQVTTLDAERILQFVVGIVDGLPVGD